MGWGGRRDGGVGGEGEGADVVGEGEAGGDEGESCGVDGGLEEGWERGE
mgnify:CR=1 FL=1